MRRSWLLVPCLIALAGCHGSSPTEPATPSLAGKYRLDQSITSDCGPSSSSIGVNIQQSGNQISFLLGIDTGSATGSIEGGSVAMQWSSGFTLCTQVLTGTGTISGRTIAGTVSGPSTSPCACGHEKIAFTLTPQ